MSIPPKRKHPVIIKQEYNHPQNNMMNDPLLDTKIEDVTSGLIPHYFNLLHEVSLSNKENALTIISYINAMRTEVNLSDNYRMDLIRLLSRFSTCLTIDYLPKRVIVVMVVIMMISILALNNIALLLPYHAFAQNNTNKLVKSDLFHYFDF